MDDRSFDAFARALGGASTRRAALVALAGLLTGGAALDADARRNRRRADRDRDDDTSAVGKRRNRKRCTPACTGNFSCVKGACTCETTVCGTACCDVGQVCQRGRCVGEGTVFCHDLGEACGDGARCCDGLACGSGNGGGPVACWPKPGQQCDSDAECLYGHHCDDGVCVMDDPPPADPGCTPTTCAAAGVACGAVPDGCDGTLDCGACAGGQTCCGGACRDLQADSANCGACGTACTGGTTCQAGQCATPPISRHVASFGTKWTNETLTGADGTLRTPFGLRLDAARTTAWVTDSTNHRVSIWTKTGNGIGDWQHTASFGRQKTTETLGQSDETLDGPIGIALDAAEDTLYIADSKNHRIVVWDKVNGAWAHTASFGSQGSFTGTSQTDSKLSYPNDVAVFTSGSVTTAYIADLVNSRVVVWRKDTADATPAWSHVASFGAECYTNLGDTDVCIPYPNGLAVDATGTKLWIVESNDRVVLWERSGGTWAHTSSAPAGFGPYMVWPDAAGTTLWVSDFNHSKIRTLTRGSGGWTAASSFGAGGAATGPTDGKLGGPVGVVVSADATTAWVADSSNGRIAIWTT